MCQVEVALTLLKLTETDRQTSRRAQVSIGMHAHPKMASKSRSTSPLLAAGAMPALGEMPGAKS